VVIISSKLTAMARQRRTFYLEGKAMAKKLDLVDNIMAWENGEMELEEEVEFFQELIDNGMAWTLQGMYGRHAAYLIDAGYCCHKAGAK